MKNSLEAFAFVLLNDHRRECVRCANSKVQASVRGIRKGKLSAGLQETGNSESPKTDERADKNAEESGTGNWKYPLPFSQRLNFSASQLPGLPDQPKQMIVLFSFSWFGFCRTRILGVIQKIFALNSRSAANFCLKSPKSRQTLTLPSALDKEQKEPLSP